MSTTWIPIEQVKPLHEVRSAAKLNELVRGLRREGWQGRPLLVVERESDYLAWTGSHRIAAAQKAGFDAVPCYVISEQVLNDHGLSAEHGHVDDSDRLNAIRKIGDDAALHIMWQEGRA